MKIYHYTQLNEWKGIKDGSWRSGGRPGLGASKRIGKVDKEAFEATAVYAFLEPLPKEWIESEKFVDSWGILKDELGYLLLEVEVDPEIDPVFVAERAHIEGFLGRDVSNTYRYEERGDAERAYLETKVPLGEYLKNPEKYGFTLPEVIVTDHVPLEDVSVSEQQPLLEERFGRYEEGSYARNHLARDVSEIPELKEWASSHHIVYDESLAEKEGKEVMRVLGSPEGRR